MGRIAKYWLDMLIIAILGVVLAGMTIPFINSRYSFEWDQANDYEAVAKVVDKGKLTLIGPRVTSDQGFFLGPWHYYFLVPFYAASGGSLYIGFWAALSVQSVLVIVGYLMTKKWWGRMAGIGVGWLLATPTSIVGWGFMYVPVLSLLFLAICLETEKTPKLLPWLWLFFGFGVTTYAVFYGLGIPLLWLTVSMYRRKKIALKNIVTAIICFWVPYTPLLVFDWRHDFINFNNIAGFGVGQHGSGENGGYFVEVLGRAINYAWFNVNLSSSLAAILMAIISIWGVGKLFPKNRVFIWVWMAAPVGGMALYRGNISEYYFTTTTVLIPLMIIGVLITRGVWGKIILGLVVGMTVMMRWQVVNTTRAGVSLGDKVKMVEVLEKMGTAYSVSYEVKLGEDGGYKTIFKKLGKNYVEDGGAQLYTISYNTNTMIKGQKMATVEGMGIYKR